MLLCLIEHGPAQQCAALEAGADACLNRALTSEVLEVQVRALLRRAPWLVRTVHHVGPIVVDEDAHLVLVDDTPIDLTRREFDLLAMLVRHAGTVLSKRLLLEQLWGFDIYDENLVEVHLSALRRRLPSPARDLIQTVRGVGYVLRASAPQDRLA
jgi:DNA-binding response OmpR family regulator